MAPRSHAIILIINLGRKSFWRRALITPGSRMIIARQYLFNHSTATIEVAL